uniref:(northern house mosquito) hypothetical protein n=1 Tax=Culex pipiens TaxID=7175 RepID=A0A8D8JEC1_CULPI
MHTSLSEREGTDTQSACVLYNGAVFSVAYSGTHIFYGFQYPFLGVPLPSVAPSLTSLQRSTVPASVTSPRSRVCGHSYRDTRCLAVVPLPFESWSARSIFRRFCPFWRPLPFSIRRVSLVLAIQ